MESKSNLYEVKVYATPMSFPFNFTVHTWVEITYNYETERYDLWAYPGLTTSSENKGYIYKDLFPDHLGTTLSPFASPKTLVKRQVGNVIIEINGDKESLAGRLYKKIKGDAFLYPFHNKYHMIWGPNCNTYIAWLLTLVPDAGLNLPSNAWGKNYVVPQ